MGMKPYEFWLMPIGFFLDLWECHRQFHGISKPAVDNTEEFEAMDLDG